jgi:hypothetical protein
MTETSIQLDARRKTDRTIRRKVAKRRATLERIGELVLALNTAPSTETELIEAALIEMRACVEKLQRVAH